MQSLPLKTTLEADRLTRYVEKQLRTHFPDDARHPLKPAVARALDRVAFCFSNIRLPAYRDDQYALFNHLHSEQYAVFLYFAANAAWSTVGDIGLASKLFCLNKLMNGMICMYDTILPDIFLIAHSIGIMLGKATYSNYLTVFQNCTIGTEFGFQPRLGEYITIYGGSTIVGDCQIGDNVAVSTQTVIRNTSIPSDHIVAGRTPNLLVKRAKRHIADEYFIRA